MDVTALNKKEGSITITASQQNTEVTASVKNSFICPLYFVGVPPLADYTTHSFCVAKYEMKRYVHSQDDSQVKAISRPALAPWGEINRNDAIEQCAALGVGYDLITNDEWQTLARHIEANVAPNYLLKDMEQQPAFNRGHSHNDPDDPDNPGRALPASEDDNDPCFNIANTCSTFLQRRTNFLSNGEVIWDLAGNISEWVKDINEFGLNYGESVDFWRMTESTHTQEGVLQKGLTQTRRNAKGHFGPLREYTVIPLERISEGNNRQCQHNRYGLGMGIFYKTEQDGTKTVEDGIVRGGYWGSGSLSGIFKVYMGYSKDYDGTDVGFRCVYHPEKNLIPPLLSCQEPMDEGSVGNMARITGGNSDSSDSSDSTGAVPHPTGVRPRTDPEIKHHFDSLDGICKAFSFSGVGGNRNRFDNFQTCQETCGGPEEPLSPNFRIRFANTVYRNKNETVSLDWEKPLLTPSEVKEYVFRKKDKIWTPEEETLIAQVLTKGDCSVASSSTPPFYCHYVLISTSAFNDYGTGSWNHSSVQVTDPNLHPKVPEPVAGEKYFYRVVITDGAGGVFAQDNKSVRIPSRASKCFNPSKLVGITNCDDVKSRKGQKWSFVIQGKKRSCQSFSYKGCDRKRDKERNKGSFNRFPSQAKCETSCMSGLVVKDVDALLPTSAVSNP